LPSVSESSATDRESPGTEIIFVTTSSERTSFLEARARGICDAEGWRYIPRRRRPLPDILAEQSLRGILVVGHDREVFWTATGTRLFYHPSLAKTRIRALAAGQRDSVATALDLVPGDRVMDANLGLATDALVIAAVTSAPVLGVEIDPVIAYLTRSGLRTYPFARYFPEGAILASQIRVFCADHTDVLRSVADRSYDAVYFSPMFIQPRKVCDDRMPLREFAPATFVSSEALREAFRVARKRVVIKINRDRPPGIPLPRGYRVSGGRRAYAQYLVYAL
jgi:hypothetical protein